MTQQPPPPARKRITAPRAPVIAPYAARPPASADASVDIPSIYMRTLVRAQLRIAIACCLGFVVTMSAAAIVVATTPALDSAYLFGVPWSWVLQAYGMYPLIALFGGIYARAAGRNETRYLMLSGNE